MADNFKTYTQAVEDGDILVWAATGDKLAKKERFDANTKFVIDNQAELWNKVNAAMILNAGTTGELNAEVAAQILELQKITANAPIALDTLKEIADSLGNDTDFATTMINQLALKANKIVDHDLVPDTANIRNLGSPEKPFKDLYLSNASLYVDGQQVLSASGDTINVSADEDQNVRITTLGVGDIEIYPKGTGTIELKGTIEVTAGKLVRTSDGTPLLIDGSIDVDGNVVADNLSAVNLNGASINTIISDVNNLKILVQSDDTTLDTLQEVVDYIQLNRSTLQALGISGISGLQTALDNLQIAINTEASTRYNETSANLVKINQESVARENADMAQNQALTNAVNNLTNLINTVQANLTAEAGTRNTADATLGQGIDESNELRLQGDNAIIARLEPLEEEYNFGKVTVGATTLTADAKTDTLTLVAGTNISITADVATDTITINANDTSVNWSEIQSKPTTLSEYGITDATPSSHVGATGTAHGVATTSVNGFMSSIDKTKLDGVATNANNYVLPTASATVIGGIKIGTNLSIDANGVVSANDTSVDWSEIQNKPDPVITLAGDLSGSVTLTDLVSGTLTATIAANSVALGTDTTGNYVAGNTAGTGIAVTGTASEGWSPTISLATAGTAGTYSKVTTDAYGRVTSGTTLSASDIPALDASKITSGTIDAARLPSYVDDVLEYAALASFPSTGETGKIYVALDTNKTYRWSGSAYVYITSGAVDSVNAGNAITVSSTTGVVTVNHADTSSQASVNNSGRTYIQAITLDTYGHITAITSATDADTYTGTVTSVSGTGSYGGLTLSGTVTSSGSLTLGGTPTGTWPISVTGSSASTTGNAATATKLATARTINGVSFDGTANITVDDSTKLPLAGGTMTGAISFYAGQTWPTFNQSTTGNAATATKLATARTIALTGGVTGSASFDGSGNISIATTASSPGATISDDTSTAATYYPTFATATSGTLTTAKVSSTKLTFNPSTGVLSSTSITELSDANFKTNVQPLEAGRIDELRPVSFEWKESGTKAYGVIAQELEQVIPEAVFTAEDGKKSVQYTQIIPFLIAEIQELKKEIKLLKGDN